VDPSLVPDMTAMAGVLGAAALMGFRNRWLAWIPAIILLGGSSIAIHQMQLTGQQRDNAMLGLIIGAMAGAIFTILIKITRNRGKNPPDQRDKR